MIRRILLTLCVLVLVFAQAGSAASELVYCGFAGEEMPARLTVQFEMEHWNQANPNVKVRWVGWPFGQALNQLLLRYISGQPVHIGQINTDWLPILVAADALVDLRTVLPANTFERYDPAALQAGEWAGKQYGLPRTTGSIAMVHNPQILKAAGIDKVPTTVDEFQTVLAAIRRSNPDFIPYAFATDVSTLGRDFQMWLRTFGGRVFDKKGTVVINSPEGIAALTWLRERVSREEIPVGLSRFDARTLFAKGRVGFYDDAIISKGFLMQQSGVSNTDELLRFARPTARPVLRVGDEPAHLAWGGLIVVFKGPMAKTAARFALEVTDTVVGMKRFETEGVPPVTKQGLQSPQVQNDGWITAWVPALTRSAKLEDTARYGQKGMLDSIIAEEVQAALTGQKTPEKALNDAAARLREAIR